MANFRKDFTKATPDSMTLWDDGSSPAEAYLPVDMSTGAPVDVTSSNVFMPAHTMGILYNDTTEGASVPCEVPVPKGMFQVNKLDCCVNYNTDLDNVAHTLTDATMTIGSAWGDYNWWDFESNGGSSGATTWLADNAYNTQCFGFYVDVSGLVGSPDIGFGFSGGITWLRYNSTTDSWTCKLRASGTHDHVFVKNLGGGIWFLEVLDFNTFTTTANDITIRIGSGWADGNFTASSKAIRLAFPNGVRYLGSNRAGPLQGLVIPTTTYANTGGNRYRIDYSDWNGQSNNGLVFGIHSTGFFQSTARMVNGVGRSTVASGEWAIDNIVTCNSNAGGSANDGGVAFGTSYYYWNGAAQEADNVITFSNSNKNPSFGIAMYPTIVQVLHDGTDCWVYVNGDYYDMDVNESIPSGLSMQQGTYGISFGGTGTINSVHLIHKIAFDESSNIDDNLAYLIDHDPSSDVKLDLSKETSPVLPLGMIRRYNKASYYDGSAVVQVDSGRPKFLKGSKTVYYHQDDGTTGLKTPSSRTLNFDKGVRVTSQRTLYANEADDFHCWDSSGGATVADSAVATVDPSRFYTLFTANVTTNAYRRASWTMAPSVGWSFQMMVKITDVGTYPIRPSISIRGEEVCFIPDQGKIYIVSRGGLLVEAGYEDWGSGHYRVYIILNDTGTSDRPYLYGRHWTGTTIDTGQTLAGNETMLVGRTCCEDSQAYPFDYLENAEGSALTYLGDSMIIPHTDALGAKGKIFGVSHTPVHPESGQIVFGSDQAAGSGEFEVQAKYGADGKLTLRTDDGTTVVDETNATAVTEFTRTEVQVEVKGSDGDQKTYCWQDNAQLGTEATHGVADTDVLDGGHIKLEFDGILHKVAITDADY